MTVADSFTKLFGHRSYTFLQIYHDLTYIKPILKDPASLLYNVYMPYNLATKTGPLESC